MTMMFGLVSWAEVTGTRAKPTSNARRSMTIMMTPPGFGNNFDRRCRLIYRKAWRGQWVCRWLGACWLPYCRIGIITAGSRSSVGNEGGVPASAGNYPGRVPCRKQQEPVEVTGFFLDCRVSRSEEHTFELQS